MSEDTLVDTLRFMAWERAKGELKSILGTIYPDYSNEDPHEDYNELKSIIDKFVEDVETKTIMG